MAAIELDQGSYMSQLPLVAAQLGEFGQGRTMRNVYRVIGILAMLFIVPVVYFLIHAKKEVQ